MYYLNVCLIYAWPLDPHCGKIPIFVQKIKFSIHPFMAGKFKFNSQQISSKLNFSVQNLRFCISVLQQKPDDVCPKQHTFWKCYFVFFYTCNYTLKTALKLQVMSQSLQECVAALRSFVPTHVIRGKMEWRTASKAWNEARRVEHNSSSYPRQHHQKLALLIHFRSLLLPSSSSSSTVFRLCHRSKILYR